MTRYRLARGTERPFHGPAPPRPTSQWEGATQLSQEQTNQASVSSPNPSHPMHTQQALLGGLAEPGLLTEEEA